jgi:hypothetical protein
VILVIAWNRANVSFPLLRFIFCNHNPDAPQFSGKPDVVNNLHLLTSCFYNNTQNNQNYGNGHQYRPQKQVLLFFTLSQFSFFF